MASVVSLNQRIGAAAAWVGASDAISVTTPSMYGVWSRGWNADHDPWAPIHAKGAIMDTAAARTIHGACAWRRPRAGHARAAIIPRTKCPRWNWPNGSRIAQ